MHRQPVPGTTLDCKIILLVPHRKIKTNRVIVFRYFFQHNLLDRFSKFFTLIIFLCFKAAYDQTFQVR